MLWGQVLWLRADPRAGRLHPRGLEKYFPCSGDVLGASSASHLTLTSTLTISPLTDEEVGSQGGDAPPPGYVAQKKRSCGSLHLGCQQGVRLSVCPQAEGSLQPPLPQLSCLLAFTPHILDFVWKKGTRDKASGGSCVTLASRRALLAQARSGCLWVSL